MTQNKYSLHILSIALMVLALPNICMPYEVEVHQDMSGAAFEKSIVDFDYLTNLGLYKTQEFNGDTAKNLILAGVKAEDDILPIARPVYHFFDPFNNKGLNAPILGEFETAPDWALGTVPNGNNLSITSAREKMHTALTSKNADTRDNAWAGLFKRLGHMIHLIQDMAQPEHVRNDGHLSLGPETDLIFTDYSRYERYTVNNRDLLQPRYEKYPSVDLPSYREYWKGDVNGNSKGKGLAEFTNQNFVSPDTNLGSGVYPSPSQTTTLPETEIISQKTDFNGSIIKSSSGVLIRYVSNSFRDIYLDTPVTNNKLAAMSFFDFKRQQMAGKPMYYLDDAVRQSHADLLAPRAVGYSAGLINYFFRGRMTITPPAEGIYAIMDHSSGGLDQNGDPDPNAGSFTKIKLNLQNTTPNQNETPPEDMIGVDGTGTFTAVAKYRRNPCYQADLSGEINESFVPANGCDINLIRTAPEEISVSAPLSGFDLISGAAPTELTFNFTQDPIPVGITSLYIQVVYRGRLGAEKDAVVAATKDVSEPTYVVGLNSTDYFAVEGVLYTAQEIRADARLLALVNGINFDPIVLNGFQLTLNNATDVMTKDTMPAAQYYRIAFIGDIGSASVTTRVTGLLSATSNIPTRQCQVDPQTSDFEICFVVGQFRGIYTNVVHWASEEHPSGSGKGDTSVMLDIPGNPVPQPVTKINF